MRLMTAQKLSAQRGSEQAPGLQLKFSSHLPRHEGWSMKCST